jgi:thiamine pyrophosphate-dependent acetolactate synthase large subunit-like protein
MAGTRKSKAASTGPAIDRPVKLKGAHRPEYASDAIADTLRAVGFKYAFINPGSSYRGLHDSMVNYLGNTDPQAVLCAHEDVCVHAAQAYAKASGLPSLAILHDLVGLMHGSMAIYNAFADHQPVVVLGGSGPADPKLRRGIDYEHSANTQGEVVRQWVKWDDEAATGEGVCESIARAYKIANTGPKGPVYVSVDAGIQESKITKPIEIPDMASAANQPPPPPAANPDAVEAAADLLVKARNPVITGGRLMYRPGSTRLLVELVELLGATYVEDRNSTCFPTAHPQNLTGEKGVIEGADVLLAIDSPDVNVVIDSYSSRVRGETGAGGKGTKVIDLSQNDYAIRSWTRLGGKVAPTAIQLLADPEVGMRQIIDAARAKIGRAKSSAAIETRRKKIAKAHDAMTKRQQGALKKRWSDTPLSPHRFVYELYSAVRSKPWMLAVRGHRAWPHGIWQFTGAGENIGVSGGGGVGYGPGAMIGASLAARDQGRFPVAILGDGDFLMQSQALWTAVHMRIPLLCVINNNTSWYNDEQHQNEVAKMRGRPMENAWIATTTRDPEADLATLARGYGAWSEGPVTDPDEFGNALKRAIAEVDGGAVAVLDVRTSPR